MAAPPSRRSLPAALPDEIVEEILLRLPPDEPACLLRASLVCKTWNHALSSHGFREFHRTPPMLGYLHNWHYEHIPRFIPTTSSSFSLAVPDRLSWQAIDCRHGRALFLSKGNGKGTKELLVWEPITGSQRCIPVPAAFECVYRNAAVLCAADGCDHRDCHGGPFHLVFLFLVEEVTDEEYEDYVTSACVYSSETGAWGELTSMHGGFFYLSDSSVLVGRYLLYFMSDNMRIQEYDVARHSLTVFNTPEYRRSNLMLTADGGLGVIQNFDTSLKLCSTS